MKDLLGLATGMGKFMIVAFDHRGFLKKTGMERMRELVRITEELGRDWWEASS